MHAQPTAEVRGSVVDARGGEALSSVVVQLVGGATALLPIPPAASGLRGARPWPVRVRAALVCTRQSLMLRVTPTALTRPAEGRHVLLPPPPGAAVSRVPFGDGLHLGIVVGQVDDQLR